MKIDTKGFSSVTELKNYIKPSRIFKVGILSISALSCLCISACNVGTNGSDPTNGLSTTNSNVVSKVKSDKISKSASGEPEIVFAPGFMYGTDFGGVFKDGVPLPKDPLGTPIPGNPEISSLSVIDNLLWATTSDNHLWSIDLEAHADYANSWKEADPGPLAPILSPVVGKYVAENGRSDLYFMVGWTLPVVGDHVCSIQYINRATSGIPLDGPTVLMENSTSYCQERSYPFTISSMGNNQHNAFTAIADRGILGIDLHTPWDSWSYGYEQLPTFPSAMYALQDKLFTVSGQNIYLSWTTLGYKDLWPIDMAPSPICGSDNPKMMQSNVIGNAGSGTVYICTTGGALIEGQGGKVAYYPTPEPIKMLAVTSDGNIYALSNNSTSIMQYSKTANSWTKLDDLVFRNYGAITAITSVDNMLIVGTKSGRVFMSVPSVKDSYWWSPSATYALEPGKAVTQLVSNNAQADDTNNKPFSYALLSNNHVYALKDGDPFYSWQQVSEKEHVPNKIIQLEADRYNLYALTSDNKIYWTDIDEIHMWQDCSPTGNAAIGFNPTQIMPIVSPRLLSPVPSEKPYLFAIMGTSSDNYLNTDIYSTDSCTAPNWIDRETPPDMSNSPITALSKSYDDSLIYTATANPFANTIFSADPSPENATNYPVVWDPVESFDTAGNTLGPIVSFQVPSIIRDNNNGRVGAIEWLQGVPPIVSVNATLNESTGFYSVTVRLKGQAMVNGVLRLNETFNVAGGRPIPGVFQSIQEAMDAVTLQAVNYVAAGQPTGHGFIVLVRGRRSPTGDIVNYQSSTTMVNDFYRSISARELRALPTVFPAGTDGLAPLRRTLCYNPDGACGGGGEDS